MDVLETEVIDRALVVRFTRAKLRNPLSRSVLTELDGIVERCAVDDSVNALIFTGTGDVFASGADLREIAELDAATAPHFARRGQLLMSTIESLSQVTIAAVNGYCFGGALDLAISCDRRIASPNAKFAHPGTGLGIITGWGGTQRLPRLIGQGNALEMLFTAAPISAERALEIGLIHAISENPFKSALKCVQ